MMSEQQICGPTCSFLSIICILGILATCYFVWWTFVVEREIGGRELALVWGVVVVEYCKNSHGVPNVSAFGGDDGDVVVVIVVIIIEELRDGHGVASCGHWAGSCGHGVAWLDVGEVGGGFWEWDGGVGKVVRGEEGAGGETAESGVSWGSSCGVGWGRIGN